MVDLNSHGLSACYDKQNDLPGELLNVKFSAWIAQSIAHSTKTCKVPGSIPGSANSAYE